MFSHALGPNCLVRGTSVPGSLRWMLDPSDPDFYCHPEKDTQYYLNIVHARSDTPGGGYSVSGCTDFSECGVLASAQ